MKTRQHFRQSLIIPYESSEPALPGKGSLNDPSSGEKYKSFFCMRELHHRKRYSMLFGFLFCLISCVALIHKGYQGGFSRYFLLHSQVRLNSLAIDNCSRRLLFPSFSQSQDLSKIMNNGLKDSSSYPSHSLLVDGIPGRKTMRDHPPGGSPSDHPSQPIEDFSQRMISLWSILFHQGQVRHDKCPFSISDITWVWFSFVFIWFHTQIITGLSTKMHNTL